MSETEQGQVGTVGPLAAPSNTKAELCRWAVRRTGLDLQTPSPPMLRAPHEQLCSSSLTLSPGPHDSRSQATCRYALCIEHVCQPGKGITTVEFAFGQLQLHKQQACKPKPSCPDCLGKVGEEGVAFFQSHLIPASNPNLFQAEIHLGTSQGPSAPKKSRLNAPP